MDFITDTDLDTETENIQPAPVPDPPKEQPQKSDAELELELGIPPEERVHSGLQHKGKGKGSRKPDSFVPLEDEDESDDEEGFSCPGLFAPFSPYRGPREEMFERDVENPDSPNTANPPENGRRKRRRRWRMPDPCCCVKAIIRNWSRIESTPLRYIVLLGISIVSILLAFIILTVVVKSLTAVWIFTKWYTGSAAEATVALIFCAAFGTFILFSSCFAMYVPACRESCCGPEISDHCGLDYRDHCCGCVVHFCQNCLDMD